MSHAQELPPDLQTSVMDILPNPVLVKDDLLRYVWVNKAFEDLFEVTREDLLGRTDQEFFVERQAAQCNGGDLRVLASGETDEAHETVVNAEGDERETLTRKNRLVLADGTMFLVGVMHDITAMRLLADTDPLTECLNRRSLDDHVAAAFAARKGRGSLVLMDIDHFKIINDTWGHDAGDAALVYFTDIVNSVSRADDRLARVGGEEFALALPGALVTEASEIANRIRARLAGTPMNWHGEKIYLTTSVGVVSKLDGRPFVLAEWLPIADERLYRAKDSGRDCVVASAG